MLMKRLLIILAAIATIHFTSSAQEFSIRQVNGQAQWSRVFEDDRDVETLKYLTLFIVRNPKVFDNMVVGEIQHLCIQDKTISSHDMAKYEFHGIVTYEFREGRYRVTVSQIMMSHWGDSLAGYSPLRPYIFDSEGNYHLAYKTHIRYIDNQFSEVFKLGDVVDSW